MTTPPPFPPPAGQPPLRLPSPAEASTARRLALWTAIGFAITAVAVIGGLAFSSHQQRGLGLMVVFVPVLLVLVLIGGLALLPLWRRARERGSIGWVWWSVVVVVGALLLLLAFRFWSTPAWHPPGS